MQAPHVVIIGGGFGGLEAAKVLAKMPVSVTLIDRRNHHLFQPLLYQVASAGLSPADIAMPIRSLLGRYRNVTTLMAEVSSIDLPQKRVELSDGSDITFDYLIVAAGAETNYFGHGEWAEHSVGLKSIEDAIEVRRRVLCAFEKAEREAEPEERKRLLTFIVIGAGPTGVELAGAISELNRRVLAGDYRRVSPEDVRVVLLDMAPRVLAGMHEDLSKSALQQLESLKVEVVLDAPVESIERARVVAKGQVFESHTVLWTAGVSPVPLAKQLVPTLIRGRVPVEKDCSLSGHPNVFVIGDMAHFETSKGPLPGVSPVAMQQGRFVAQTILASIEGRPRQTFRYVDRGMMATVGRSRAVAEVRGWKFTGFVAWLAWLAVHLFYLVGFKNRVFVLMNWIWQYLAYRRGARLITPCQRTSAGSRGAPEPEERAAPDRGRGERSGHGPALNHVST
ncbi:MAG: NAD(P)/FAD-dependent oxidoreductase [Myxococcales bacterium]|nr:NAD(P)/FAD-dependent oxidoreductase [Myxococcales bacterium]